MKYLNDLFVLLVTDIRIFLIFFKYFFMKLHTDKDGKMHEEEMMKMNKNNSQNSAIFNGYSPPQLSCYLPGKHSETRSDSDTKFVCKLKKNTEK
jgi:hypothetical protein